MSRRPPFFEPSRTLRPSKRKRASTPRNAWGRDDEDGSGSVYSTLGGEGVPSEGEEGGEFIANATHVGSRQPKQSGGTSTSDLQTDDSSKEAIESRTKVRKATVNSVGKRLISKAMADRLKGHAISIAVAGVLAMVSIVGTIVGTQYATEWQDRRVERLAAEAEEAANPKPTSKLYNSSGHVLGTV